MLSNQIQNSINRQNGHNGFLTALLLMAATMLLPFGGGGYAALAQVTQTTFANTAAQSLSNPNGNKVVVAPDNSLHAVYVVNGQLRYARSAEGASWIQSAIASNAQTPTIAVAKAGSQWAVGVAFVDTSNTLQTLKYIYKIGAAGPWIGPFTVIDDGNSQQASEPSMAGFDDKMHLTWIHHGIDVLYAEFTPTPAIGSSAVTSQRKFVDGMIAPGTRSLRPSIAVSKSGKTNGAPLVRIAYFYTHPSNNVQKVWVKVRTKPENFGDSWYNSLGSYGLDRDFDFSNIMVLESLSLTTNPMTGDFYLGFSWESVGKFTETWLYHENAWNQPNTWDFSKLANSRTQIDVAANNSANPALFRVALSETANGKTWHRTGKDLSTWVDSWVLASSTGRDPQAIFWGSGCSIASGKGVMLLSTWRDIHAIFTANINISGFAIQRSNVTGSCLNPAY